MTLGETSSELVADVDLAAPHVRLEVRRGQAPLAMGIGQRREARAPAQVGLGRPDRAHVQLVIADDGDPHPDRARPAWPSAAALAGVARRLLAARIALTTQTRMPADSS